MANHFIEVFTATVPFFQFSLYQMCIMFVFWSCVGWAVEVVTMTIETGEYQNRGFLNMPLCPIYGAGVLLVVSLFRPFAHTWILLFFLTALMCTAFELSVGLIMEKIFHNRWWDYSMYKFNFKGYICLWTSCGWGIGCVLVIKFVQPFLERVIAAVPFNAGCAFIALMFVIIMIDTIASIRAAVNLNMKLRKIDELSKLMLKSAQTVGGKLAGATQRVMGAAETAKDAASEKRVEIKDDIVARYEAIISARDAATDRLLNAFPTMRSLHYSEALRILRERHNIKALLKSRFDAKADKTISVVTESVTDTAPEPTQQKSAE
ncbi:MAG: putative ABC transporter permease [Ruminococcus sp.]|jgi:uncharacterized membrane protein|nr:putative ABC transporter permease [Ruminococcus sp.]